MIVQFLIHHESQMFDIPEGFKEKVDARVSEIKVGNIPVVKGKNETFYLTCSIVKVHVA